MKPQPERLRDTYRAECLCGATVESHTREATCPRCGRQLVYEWGRPPLVVSDADWLAHQERLCAAWLTPQDPQGCRPIRPLEAIPALDQPSGSSQTTLAASSRIGQERQR